MPNEQWEERLVRVQVRPSSYNPANDLVQMQFPGEPSHWYPSKKNLDAATVTPPDMKEVEGLVEKLAVVLTNPPKPRHTVGELQAWHKAEDDARAALLSAISALAAPRVSREELGEMLSSLSIAYANKDESHIEFKTNVILDAVCGKEPK